MAIVTAVGNPELEQKQKSDAVLCQRASFTSMISTTCLKLTRMGVAYMFELNKHTKIFTNHTCGVFLHTAILYPPVNEQFACVLCQNKRNPVQNSQMAQSGRTLREGFLNIFVICWGGPAAHVPVGAHSPADFKQHQFHIHVNHRVSITWRLKPITI